MLRALRAFREFFRKLADGEPVAIGFLIGFVILAAITMVIVYAVHRKLQRDDADWRRRRGYGPAKK